MSEGSGYRQEVRQSPDDSIQQRPEAGGKVSVDAVSQRVSVSVNHARPLVEERGFVVKGTSIPTGIPELLMEIGGIKWWCVRTKGEERYPQSVLGRSFQRKSRVCWELPLTERDVQAWVGRDPFAAVSERIAIGGVR